jgi:uncharacterized membrane protein
MNSEKFSNRPSGAPPNWILALFLVFSFMGFADSTYLTVKHYSGTPLECSIFHGCEKVTTSPYANLAGIPLALLGMIYYAAIIVLIVAHLDSRRKSIFVFAARATVIGFLASAWFVYLQLYVIRAVCPYCMLSAVVSTLLFVLGRIALRSRTSSKRGLTPAG